GQPAPHTHYVDGTMIPAHQHAAGAPSRDADAEALGRSQGGFSTTVHVRADGQGKLMTLVLTPGHRHEAPVFPQLMAQGAVKRAGGGRPKRSPRRVVGDKAYSSGTIRTYCRQHGIRITIPRKSNECRTGPFDRGIYRTRERVERMMVVFQKWRWTAIAVTLGLVFVASLRKEGSMTFIAVRCPHC